MSCGCEDNTSFGGYDAYNNICNADTPYPIASAESVPSLISNLTLALYGQIQKDVSGGKVVWIIPCDPNNTAYIGSLPRNPGEGLLCYLIRYFNTVYTGSALQIPYGGTGAATAEDALNNLGGVPVTRSVLTESGSGLLGGGQLTDDLSLSIQNTTVTPGTYGGQTKIPVIEVNARGQLTEVTEVAAEGFATVESELITATAQQDVFNLTTLTYSPGTDNLAVYRNGIRLLVGLDYTETNSSTVTLTRGVAAGNQLLFESGRIITQDVSAIGASTETQTATAQQDVFTLTVVSYFPGNNSLSVYRNGLKLVLGIDYVETNSATVTLTSPAALGDQFVFESGKILTEAVSGGSVTFLQAGTGAVTRNMQDKARESVSVLDFGADPTGSADSAGAFSSAGSSAATVQVEIPSGIYKLLTNPVVTGKVTWVVHKGASFTGAGTIWSASNKIVSLGDFRSIQSSSSFYSGVFGYLEQNAAETGYGTIGINAVARTAGGSGAAGEADIGVAGFALNELVGGLGGAWALYGTAIRQAGVNGPTHGLELDIANMGTTVPLFPAAMGAAGQTHALWLATGGEVTNVANAGTASVALGIIRNDSNASPSAAFEKGIVFHNVALAGCDGATGNGIAIAMASGHQMVWYNNSNEPVAEIVANNKLVANQQRIDFNNYGILFQDRNNGRINLRVENNSSSVNYFSIRSGSSTDGPHLKAIGDDPAIDIWLEPKGGGVLGVTYGSTPASNPAAFSATRRLAFKDGNNITWYIPISTVAW